MKAGDTIYFTTSGRMVNEGTVLSVESPYIRIKTKAPGVTHVMESEAFPTKEELRASKAYSSAYRAKCQRQRMNASITRMASLWR